MYVDEYSTRDVQSVFLPVSWSIRCTLNDSVIYVKIVENYQKRHFFDGKGQVLFCLPHKSIVYQYEISVDDIAWLQKNHSDLQNALGFLLSHKSELKKESFFDHDTVIGVAGFRDGIEVDRIEIGEFELYEHTDIFDKIKVINNLLMRIKKMGKIDSIQDMDDIKKLF